MLTIKNKIKLLELIENKAFLITPTNRLSLQIQEEYAIHSKNTVAKPNIFSYKEFLNILYKNCSYKNHNIPILLSKEQEWILFYDTIKNNYNLPETICNSVQNAWKDVQQWGIDINAPYFTYNEQTQQFQIWAQSIQKHLSRLNAITQAQLEILLTKYISLTHKEVIWFAFDSFTPQQENFQKHLKRNNCKLYIFEPEENNNIAMQYNAATQEEEFFAIKHWYNTIQKDNHISSCSIIVPNLHQDKIAIKNMLDKVFAENIYEITLGDSLYDQNLIQHAYKYLSFCRKKFISRTDAIFLLTSPFMLDSDKEKIERANLLEHSLMNKERFILFQEFLNLIKNLSLYNILQEILPYPSKESPLKWIDLFQNRLLHFGFPGDSALLPNTYQCYKEFLETFAKFNTLGLIKSSMTLQEALFCLKQILSQQIFQVKSIHKKPIKIMGLLEASGCSFDAIWLMNTSTQYFPQNVKFSPWIPTNTQIQLNMPRASSMQETLLAKQYLDRLRKSSKFMVCSYAKIIDENINIGSSFINHYPIHNLDIILPQKTKDSLIPYTDPTNLEFLPQENKNLGSINLLSNQAKCPFKAIAANRLHIKIQNITQDGVSLVERGKYLHKILEKIWMNLQNQDNLLAINKQELKKIISSNIENTLQIYTKNIPYSLNNFTIKLESLRLYRLLELELNWEKARKPFKIYALEYPLQFELYNMHFSLRIDRIDEINDKYCIIDYKTSLPTKKPWQELRPTQTQVLIYALAQNKVETIMFLELSKSNIKCLGISEKSQDLKGIEESTDLKEQKNIWQENIIKLIAEFQEGICKLSPIDKSTCLSCEYKSLCRHVE